MCIQVACLSRGLLFTLWNAGAIEDSLYRPALCTYYALITSSLALIVCYWSEIFFTEDAARGAAKRYLKTHFHKKPLTNLIRNKTSILKFRPRFLTKSRLAFTIFNSLLIGLLLIHFAASQFYDKNSDQPPNMVFPALFATGKYFKIESFETFEFWPLIKTSTYTEGGPLVLYTNPYFLISETENRTKLGEP